MLRHFETTPSAPFDAELALALNVIDSDGVAYASNPARFGTATAGNGIGDAGAAAVAEALKVNKTVTTIDLYST